jgi:tRNA (guanine-N7-)-methyltransferase
VDFTFARHGNEFQPGQSIVLPLIRLRQGCPPARPPDWHRAFGRAAPLEVDLGCGRGHYALARARAVPDSDLVAIDTRFKWIRGIRDQIRRDGLTNLRAIRCDAGFDLPLLFGPGTVQGFSLLHPDPWWKKRHRKRRLVQPAWIEMLAGMLVPGGWFYAQTDVPDLGAEIAEVVEGVGLFDRLDADAFLADRLGGIQSHRGNRCGQLGIPVKRMAFVLPPAAPGGSR